MKNGARKLVTFLVSIALIAVYCFPVVQARADGTVTTAEELKSAVEAGGEITLGSDITSSITIPSGTEVTLNLAGYTLTNEEGSDTITVANGAVLTVTGDGMVDNVSNSKAAIVNNGTANLNGGTFKRSLEDGVAGSGSTNTYYTVMNHGTTTIDGASIENSGTVSSTIENGYYNYTSTDPRNGYVDGVNEANPKLTVKSGTMTGGRNTIKNDDGGILEISGGSISGALSAAVLNWNIATISGGEFTSNCGGDNSTESSSVIITASVEGYEETTDQGSVTITGGTFTAPEGKHTVAMNTYYSYAGEGTITISGGTFSDDVSEYAAEGFVLYQNDDGTYYVAGKLVRVYGANRYETSEKLADYESMDAWRNEDGLFDSIILACGSDFPDALSGSTLSLKVHAPIILYHETKQDMVSEYLQENLAAGGTIYLLGGDGVIPASYEVTLNTKGYKTVRLGGANRYETNLLILGEAGVADGDDILVASSMDFADSISASCLGKALVLVGSSLTDAQAAFFKAHSNSQVYILGGTGAVSAEVEEALAGLVSTQAVRLGGKDRYETSVLIAEEFFEDPSQAVIAYSLFFPDGLCAGPVAGVMGECPVLLANDAHVDEASAYLSENGIHTGLVTGGSTLISDESVHKIFDNDAPIAVNP